MSFLIGFFVGGIVGIFLAAIMAAGRDDREA